MRTPGTPAAVRLSAEQIAALETLLGGLVRAPDADPWVNVAEAPVPARALRDAARRGELRAFRVAKRLLVRRSELDGWIERHAVTPAAPPERPATLLDRLGPRAPAGGDE